NGVQHQPRGDANRRSRQQKTSVSLYYFVPQHFSSLDNDLRRSCVNPRLLVDMATRIAAVARVAVPRSALPAAGWFCATRNPPSGARRVDHHVQLAAVGPATRVGSRSKSEGPAMATATFPIATSSKTAVRPPGPASAIAKNHPTPLPTFCCPANSQSED